MGNQCISKQLHRRMNCTFVRSMCMSQTYRLPSASGVLSGNVLSCTAVKRGAIQHASSDQPQADQDTLSKQPTAPQVSSTAHGKRGGESIGSKRPQTEASVDTSTNSNNGDRRSREGGSTGDTSSTSTASSSFARSGVSREASTRVVSATGSAASPAAVCIAPDDDLEAVLRAAVARIPGMSYGEEHKQLVYNLKQEGYDTASSLAEMEADSMKELVRPRRLTDMVKRVLREQQEAWEAAAEEQSRAEEQGAGEEGNAHLNGVAEGDEGEEEEQGEGEAAEEQGGQTDEDNGRVAAMAAGGTGQQAGQQQQQQVEEEELPADIMQRRCPDKFRFKYGSGREVRLTGKARKEPYALTPAATPPRLATELLDFENFCVYGSYAAQGEPVRPITAAQYVQCLRQALGWLHNVERVAVDELELRLLVPGTRQRDAKVVFRWTAWMERERGLNKRSLSRCIAAAIQAAKYLYHEQSRSTDGDKPYSDLEVVKALRVMYRAAERATRVSGHAVDDGLKWLQWPQYLDMVRELRSECAGLRHNGIPRSSVDVAMSLQHYLIAAILACVPDRQRTLRELKVGRTLVRDAATGTWSIRHGAEDYKTGGTYGERPPLLLSPELYPELEAFIDTWRAQLNPKHDFLFSKRDGSGPLTATELSRSFSLNAYRLTGRKTNPHLVRDMVVTHARSGHATEHELEALAVYMGHSLAEQRGTYDRRTKAQKVAPALGLMAKLNATGSGSSGGSSSGSGGRSGAGSSSSSGGGGSISNGGAAVASGSSSGKRVVTGANGSGAGGMAAAPVGSSAPVGPGEGAAGLGSGAGPGGESTATGEGAGAAGAARGKARRGAAAVGRARGSADGADEAGVSSEEDGVAVGEAAGGKRSKRGKGAGGSEAREPAASVGAGTEGTASGEGDERAGLAGRARAKADGASEDGAPSREEGVAVGEPGGGKRSRGGKGAGGRRARGGAEDAAAQG